MADEHVAAAGQHGAHVGTARVPPLLDGLTIGQAGDRFEGGRGGAPTDRRCNRRARAGCQRTSQPWPHSWSLRRPRVSNDETSYLLGDVVHHPLQLNDQRISFLSEAEPERALRVREELLTALQGRNVSIGMAHFPGLDFQQITTANGRAWSTAG